MFKQKTFPVVPYTSINPVKKRKNTTIRMQTVHEIHHYLEIQTHVIYAVRIRQIGTAYRSFLLDKVMRRRRCITQFKDGADWAKFSVQLFYAYG